MAGLAAGCSEEADEPAPLVTEGAATGTLFVHGHVLVDGEPLVGAEVTVSVMSNEDLEVGGIVDTFDVDAESGSDGRYAIRIDPDDVAEKFWESYPGILNYDVRVISEQLWGSWATTMSWHPKDGVWRLEGEDPAGDHVGRMDFDLGAERVTVTKSDATEAVDEMPVGELQPTSGEIERDGHTGAGDR